MSVFGRKVILTAVVAALLPVAMFARDVALVSNKSNSIQDIALADLEKVCKGHTVRWPDGKPVTFVMMPPGAPEMKTVLQKVYGSSAVDVESLITTANHERKNHSAIVIVSSPEGVVQKVEATPGAVGVVDVYSITSGVTVLKIDGKLPLQPGYLLHGN